VKRLFGPASSGRVSSASPQSCVRIWSALRLEVEFFAFESNPCLRGVALIVTVRGRAAWRTALGLRVGDTAARIRSLYPRARLRGAGTDGGYWLVTRQVCAEVGGAYPGLLARMQPAACRRSSRAAPSATRASGSRPPASGTRSP
jgi:hypothetical protein